MVDLPSTPPGMPQMYSDSIPEMQMTFFQSFLGFQAPLEAQEAVQGFQIVCLVMISLGLSEKVEGLEEVP